MRVIVAIALVLLVAPAVRAQERCEPTAGALSRARELFSEGSAHVENLRWADAVASFDRAYALSCAPSALYNLAMAQRGLGRHREARDAFVRLLEDHPDLAPELRAQAETYRAEEAARVAVLEVTGLEPDLTGLELRFDGRPIDDDGERPIRLETDAGDHSLLVRVPERQPFLWEGRLSDGQRLTIPVELQALPPSGGGFDAVPLVLGIVAALLVGGGVTAGVLLYNAAQIDPLRPDRVLTVTP